MSHIFISHVEEDAETALEIAQELESAGYQTWYYERDNIPGLSYLLLTARAIEESHAIIVIISPHAIKKPSQMTRELVRGHETIKYFIPILLNLTHAEFQQHQPEWRQIIGSATSIQIPPRGVKLIAPRILLGLKALGIHPTNPPLLHSKFYDSELLRANQSKQGEKGTRQIKVRPSLKRSQETFKSADKEKSPQPSKDFNNRFLKKYRFYLVILLLATTITGGVLILKMGIISSTPEIITRTSDLWESKSAVDVSAEDIEGVKYLKNNQPDKAIKSFTRGLDKNPTDSYAYHSRGFAYFKTGQYDKAILDLDRALELEPEESNTYHVRALVYGRKGLFERSIADFDKALRLGPTALIIWNKAATCEEAGRLDEAIDAYKRFIVYANGTGYEFRIALARTKITKLEEKTPNKITSEHSQKPQELTSGDYFDKGLTTKDPDKEIIFYTKAITLNQRFAEAYNNRGFAYYRKGMLDQAIIDYTKSIEINSLDGLAYNNRAVAYYYKKDYDKAWKDIKQAQKLGHKVNHKIYKELLNYFTVN